MKLRAIDISLIILGSCLYGAISQASMLERWDTARLTQESKSIRIGQVTSRWSSWDPDKRMVYTYIKLRVDETLKGDSRSEVLIRQPGGQAAGVGMVVHGMASFQKGERALIFLKHDADGAPTVSGMAQGKYLIKNHPDSGTDFAEFEPPSNAEFYIRGARGENHEISKASIYRKLPLQELVREIRFAISGENKMAP